MLQIKRVTQLLLIAAFLFPLFAGEVEELLKSKVESFSKKDRNEFSTIKLLPSFYEKRSYKLAWNSKNSSDLRRLISEMEYEGLYPADYHESKIDELTLELSSQKSSSLKKQVQYDLLQTDALITIVYHLLFGKVDPEALDANWNFNRRIENVDAAQWIQNTLDSGILYDIVKELSIDERFFTVLREGLQSYRAVMNSGGWESIPEGTAIKVGDEDSRLPLIRKRLALTNDYPGILDTVSIIYDSTTFRAVQNFQERHGIVRDGIIGKGTLSSMNVPVEKRVEQIQVNLERARWVFHDLVDEFIVVNIAGYYAHYIKDNRVIWREKAQVGTTVRQTPVFKAEMNHLVFNPTWTVPPTILREDVLPAIQKDQSYLTRKNMSVIDSKGKKVDASNLDWNSYKGSNFPYMIRQEPSASNALGLVKFMFPNKHFIFIHDTPSKANFEKENRAFSSGCIRVENPFLLAEAVLKESGSWDQKKIKAVIDSKKMTRVNLNKNIPVLLLYATAFPNNNSSLKNPLAFRDDIYKRDEKIMDGLTSAFKPRR